MNTQVSAEEMAPTGTKGKHSKTVTKVERFGWIIKDRPGVFKYLSKHDLNIPTEYQREAGDGKVLAMASEWSWIALGALIVGYRDGKYWVIDGQHRVLAAMKRHDVIELPCLIFETEGSAQEAKGFLDVNTGRKPLTSIDRFRARIVTGDPVALYVSALLERLHITPKRGGIRTLEISCLNWVLERATENISDLETVMALAAEMSRKDEVGLHEKLLAGLYYIQRQVNVINALDDRRLRQRVTQIGATGLIAAASKAAAYFANGGAKIWANGMLDSINHGLQYKFTLAPSPFDRTSVERPSPKKSED